MSGAAVRAHRGCNGVRLCRSCAAEYLGVSIDVFDDVVRPALPAVRIGARVGFLRADLDGYTQAHREAPSAGRQNQRSSSAGASGTTDSPYEVSASAVRRASEIAAELRDSSPRNGTRRTARSTSRLRLLDSD